MALRRQSLALPLLLVAAVRAAGAAEVPSAETASGIWRFLDPRTAPFIPIPEVGTDPNSGTSFGLLGVYLDTNEEKEITRIIAPDFVFNPELGYGGHFRLFAYPSKDQQWSVLVGAKERIERELDLNYATGLTRQETFSLAERAVYDRSASERFFGIGNGTTRSTQTNYTADRTYAQLRLGWNITPTLQLAYDARPRRFQVEHGSFAAIASIESKFPGVAGLGVEHEWLNRAFLTWDTRDSSDVPTKGHELVAFAGLTDRSFLSSTSYSLFGLDGRNYAPLGPRFTLATHASLRYMPVGDDAPFWALSSLGGDRSKIAERQPLRGVGDNRFIDRNLFAASAELRTRVFDLDVFSTQLTFEVAPFVDTGRVFHELDDNPLRSLHWAGGVGFRGVAPPFIVGYVDVGFAAEGLAIFSGIDYPF
jgi:outer membrane protein assembly factor BamA